MRRSKPSLACGRRIASKSPSLSSRRSHDPRSTRDPRQHNCLRTDLYSRQSFDGPPASVSIPARAVLLDSSVPFTRPRKPASLSKQAPSPPQHPGILPSAPYPHSGVLFLSLRRPHVASQKQIEANRRNEHTAYGTEWCPHSIWGACSVSFPMLTAI